MECSAWNLKTLLILGIGSMDLELDVGAVYSRRRTLSLLPGATIHFLLHEHLKTLAGENC